MTAKRFEIVKSKLIKDGWVISDKIKQFTFPTLKGDKRALISYCKALNELHEENEDLATKKEDAEYELLHLKEMYEELLEEKEKYKKEMLYFKRELQKELVCQAGREKND